MGNSRKYGLVGLVVLGFVAALFLLSRQAGTGESTSLAEIVGHPVPDVSLQDELGKEIVLRERLKGLTLISLWATWCAPCLKELPLLQKRSEALAGQGVSIVLVNYEGGSPDAARKQARDWLSKNEIKLATLFDLREGLLEALGLSALPYSMLVNRSGTIVWQQQGIVEFEALDEAIKEAGHR